MIGSFKYLRFLIGLIISVMTFTLLANPPAVQTSNQYIDELLLAVDDLKISDPKQFNTKLKELHALQRTASQAQIHFIQYYEIYRLVAQGNLKKAESAFNKLFGEVSDLSVKIRIKATLANMQAITRDYNQSLSNLDYIITQVKDYPDQVLKNKVNFVAANVYYLLDLFDMSTVYADLVIKDAHDDIYLCIANAIKLGAAFKSKQNIEHQALVHDVIELCRNNNQIGYALSLTLNWIRYELGQFQLQGDFESIGVLKTLVQSHESEIDDTESQNFIGLKDQVLAQIYYALKDFEKAEFYANKSIEGSNQAGNTSQVVESLKILNYLAVENKDIHKAYEYVNQINQVENEIFSDSIAKQMAFMTVKHANLAKELEIEQLSKLNEVLALEKKLVRQESNIQRLWIFLILTLLGFLLLLILRMKRRFDHFKNVSDLDHLTKVLTRKAFEEQMSTLLKRMKPDNLPVFLVIMDLDRFKLVNDTHGHLTGDWVLKNVIYACKEVIAENMMIARLGGEEFCIVISELNEKSVLSKIEAMRHAVESLNCSDSGADLSVTASFGITSSEVSGYSLNMLLTHADVALFTAKNQGRNQVVLYDANSSSTTTQHSA